MTKKITLGAKYTDRITGFTGICTGYVQYLTGCNQALLAPATKDDGSLPDSNWFDEQRLTLVENFTPIVLDNGSNPGSDKAAPKR